MNSLSRSLSILFDLEIALKTGDKPDSMLPALLSITPLTHLKEQESAAELIRQSFINNLGGKNCFATLLVAIRCAAYPTDRVYA